MTGYRGRFAVSEVLRADDEFRQLIVARAPVQEMKRHVAGQHTRSLRESALQSVLDGITTEEEFLRVVAAH
jgi:general secretion pathway protein E